MLKKIFTFTTLLLTGLFGFSLEAKAATTSFSYTNFYSTFYGLVSVCVPLNPSIEVLTFTIPENPYTVYTLGGINTSLTLYGTTNCTGATSSNRLFSENDPTGSVNKTYFFDYSDATFSVNSMRITLMTKLDSSIAPSGYVNFMSTETEFNQAAPYTAIYYNGLVEYDRKLFAVNVPQTTDPTRAGFVFDYWKDRNGDVYDYQLPPNESQLQLDLNGNEVFYLYASFSESIEIDLSDFDFFPPILPSDRPIDILLFNTGFYNDAGFVFLYALFIIGSSVLLWYLKVPTLVNVIDDIVITALFMVAGYLPVYAAILMIMLFIVMFISINKSGGLLNE